MIRRQWRIARGNLTSCDTNPQLTRSRAGEDLPTLSAMTPATSVPRPDRRLLVLDTAVGAFLARPDLAPRSRTVYGQTLTRLITDLGPQFPVTELSGAELSAFLQRHYGHAAPATWNLNLATLHSFLAFCTRHGALQADPSTAIERRTLRTNPDRRVIPTTQLEALWHRDDLPLREKTLWRLAYDSAARANEILSLDIPDLDLPAKTATITGKAGIPRQINWYTHTAHLLARFCARRRTGPLFLAQRHPRRAVANADQDPTTGHARLSYRRAAELFTTHTGWTLHQLRHTRIRELKDQHCPLPVLQKITGHTSLRTLTEHYPGPSPDTVRAWYDNTDPTARRRRH
jgi:integrase